MKVKNFTTTLSTNVIDMLSQIAKKEGISKRQIIETAVLDWQKNRLRKALRTSYMKAKDDVEMLELANSDLEDWEQVIQNG